MGSHEVDADSFSARAALEVQKSATTADNKPAEEKAATFEAMAATIRRLYATHAAKIHATVAAVGGIGAYVAVRGHMGQVPEALNAVVPPHVSSDPSQLWAPPSREEMLRRLGCPTLPPVKKATDTNTNTDDNGEFDLLIVGGGATGVGCALDAATRGLKVALVERDDFSSGTSSRSTKLVHGGVRYLEKAFKELDIEQYKLVVEALHERSIFLKIAPYLSYQLPIMLP
ncbi:hypothetical protein BC830DRAFT_706418, partial [Chytriomyces sp. MP71]